MRGPQALADVLRVVARGLTIILLPVIALYLIFVGLQLASGEPGFLGMFLNLILLLLLGLGLIIAWRREGFGAMLALGALAGFLALGTAFRGFAATFGSSPLVWPISLVVALVKEQSFDPVPSWILVTSWLLIVLPILSFLGSWMLRRKPAHTLPTDPDGSAKDIRS